MFNGRPSDEHFIVAPSLHRRPLPIRNSGDWGEMIKEWSNDSGLISTLILLVNSTDMILPLTPIILSLAPGTMDPLNGGCMIGEKVALYRLGIYRSFLSIGP